MRIIGGEAKGRHVFYPPKSRARPTTDRIKESLFNILGPLNSNIFLDAYAGAGNVGIEALSRGAVYAAFIENDAALTHYIEKNLLLCGFAGKSLILRTTVEQAFYQFHRQGILFNFIFSDPPYNEGLVNETLLCLARVNIIADDGIVIFQHSKREAIELARTSKFILFDQRKYGDTILSFLKIQ